MVLLAGLAGACWASPVRAQTRLAEQVQVIWLDGAPELGQVAYLTVRQRPPTDTAAPAPRFTVVRGAIDRAPLYFEPHDGAFVALAPVGLDAADSARVTLWLEDARGRVETVEARVPVRHRAFPVERLTVAPEFSRRPDAALQARIDREFAQSRAVSARALETPRLWDGVFQTPREARITSGFGLGREFNGELTSRHTGTDLDGRTGEPVLAANRGVVALVGDFYYAGNVIYLNHGAGLVTAYMHLSETLVAAGDTVTPGQVIGRVGATGRVTGPHLHWMARHGRVTVDALSLLSLPELPMAASGGRGGH